MLTPVMQQKRRDRLMITLKFWYRSSNGLSFGRNPASSASLRALSKLNEPAVRS